ncbi:hypothetical protein ACFQY0_05060 [Haloferula chungangensis]|uniref:Uncharacterized protein n=1 Tax=Haloferula chungangensis TaxID=1048331 RepID=A0ABW2L2H0_9BACT
MAEQARVASIDALEEFRTALLRYQNRATQSLDDVSGDVKQMREWITFDRRMHWQSEVKRRTRKLEQAEAELMSSKFSELKDDHSVQQLAVKKASRSLAEAEEKLRVTKRWARDFDAIVAPGTRQLDGMRERLSTSLPKSISAMGETIGLLRDYAEVRGVRRHDRDGPATTDEEGGEA